MSSFDPELLKALASADAALPPPPGAAFTVGRLTELAARRARRTRLATAAALLLVAFGIALASLPAAANARDTDDQPMASAAAELRALRQRLDQLTAAVRSLATAHDTDLAVRREQRLRNQLRLDFANARADAVLAMEGPTNPTTRR